ncbi:MAG: hypothetical protein OXG95_10420 [Chloroflexi bacterium]|nr:hypothetical protein [Chloroflexota bacterium]
MDREAVEAYARKRNVSKDPDTLGLHTELLPVPFVGNPRAPVVLLNGNPGFSDKDEADHEDPAFWEAASRNLTHEVAGPAFFPIDPRFKNTAAYKWWTEKLGPLIGDVGFESVANGVFCLEAYPYHSRTFPKGTDVPSQAYTRSMLLERIKSRAFIVGMRARKVWEPTVPALRSYSPIHWLNNPRNPTFSPRNLDCYDDLVSVLKQYGS